MTGFVRCLSAVAFVALTFPLASVRADEGEPATRKPLQLIDVFQLELASDPQISPDGRQVVFVRNFMDIMKDRRRTNLWIIGSDGKDLRPLTTGDRNDSSPRWSPDGTRLLYVSSESGNAEVYCRWIDSGLTARLTQLAKEPSDLAWSPNGRRIAFTMFVPAESKPYVALTGKPEGAEWAAPPKVIQRTLYRADGRGYLKDGFQQVFVLPAEGGTPTQVTSGEFHHEGPLAWSLDGSSLYLHANRDPRWEEQPLDDEVYELTLADRRFKALTDRKGPDRSPVVSPDGTKIAWLGFDDERLSYHVIRLHVMNRDGSNRRVLTTTLDRDAALPQWNSDSDGLFFQYDDSGSTTIGFVDLEGKVTPLTDGVGGATFGRPYASGSFSSSRDGRIAFTLSRTDHPAEVAVWNPKTKSAQRLTRLNDDLFSQRTLGETTERATPSSFDKRSIPYWMVKPPGFAPGKKYPLLLEIHGGPFANYGSRFSAEMQLYAAAGYVVVYANPRGSTGYGKEFANLIHHAYPGNDFDDLMSVVDNAVSLGFVDPEQLYVTGGSGGGILTAWIVGHTDRFRAAVSAKPVINWESFVLTSDMYPFFAQYWFPGPPWEHREHYLKRSPLTYVDKVKTPTLLITGEQDHRTPISESEQFYQALRLRHIDSALIRVPDSSHDIVARPSRFMVQVSHTLKWFETHRGKK